MQDEWFEWDDLKAASNLAKHDISFDEARAAFDDPFLIERFDDRMDYEEDRFVAYAMNDGVILMIAYTMRGERTRIITARKASKREMERYDRNRTT